MSQLTDEEMSDTFASAFCKHFCANKCKANESNDCCWCTEAAIVAAEEVRRLTPPRLSWPLSSFKTIEEKHRLQKRMRLQRLVVVK